MFKSLISITLFWLVLVSFTGNLLKVYSDTLDLSFIKKNVTHIADGCTEKESSDEKDNSNQKEVESYLISVAIDFNFSSFINLSVVFPQNVNQVEQEYFLDLIKPPLNS